MSLRGGRLQTFWHTVKVGKKLPLCAAEPCAHLLTALAVCWYDKSRVFLC